MGAAASPAELRTSGGRPSAARRSRRHTVLTGTRPSAGLVHG
ncbi:hypothetical protein DUI70_4138 [Streptomyces albus]|nr:hypothetical protein DUI70_4138 [Streptomyces albus]